MRRIGLLIPFAEDNPVGQPSKQTLTAIYMFDAATASWRARRTALHGSATNGFRIVAVSVTIPITATRAIGERDASAAAGHDGSTAAATAAYRHSSCGIRCGKPERRAPRAASVHGHGCVATGRGGVGCVWRTVLRIHCVLIFRLGAL